LFGFLGRKRISTLVNGAYASTFVTQGFIFGKPTNKKKKNIDIKRMFKEKWATQFPWVEPLVVHVSKIHMMYCKVCSMVEGKEKLLNLKSNGL
jgi:hypothetical protein